MSDFLDRTLKFGYVLSSIVLFCGVLAILLAWYRTTGKIEFEDISTRQNEIFYGDDFGIEYAGYGVG
ncbi:hypothetical protein ACFE35_28835 [Phormidesmis priestleyi ANT.L61.2]